MITDIGHEISQIGKKGNRLEEALRSLTQELAT